MDLQRLTQAPGSYEICHPKHYHVINHPIEQAAMFFPTTLRVNTWNQKCNMHTMVVKTSKNQSPAGHFITCRVILPIYSRLFPVSEAQLLQPTFRNEPAAQPVAPAPWLKPPLLRAFGLVFSSSPAPPLEALHGFKGRARRKPPSNGYRDGQVWNTSETGQKTGKKYLGICNHGINTLTLYSSYIIMLYLWYAGIKKDR